MYYLLSCFTNSAISSLHPFSDLFLCLLFLGHHSISILNCRPASYVNYSLPFLLFHSFCISYLGIVTNMLECSIVVSNFKLQLYYYIHFQTNTLEKRYESPNSSSYGLNSVITVFFTRIALAVNNPQRLICH